MDTLNELVLGVVLLICVFGGLAGGFAAHDYYAEQYHEPTPQLHVDVTPHTVSNVANSSTVVYYSNLSADTQETINATIGGELAPIAVYPVTEPEAKTFRGVDYLKYNGLYYGVNTYTTHPEPSPLPFVGGGALIGLILGFIPLLVSDSRDEL